MIRPRNTQKGREMKYDRVLPLDEMAPPHTVAEEVEHVDDEIRSLVRSMHKLCKTDGGAGLAAPQVGCLKRVIVVNHQGRRLAMINPVLEDPSGSRSSNEGCLSVGKGRRFKIERHERVGVQYQDTHGIKLRGAFTGAVATIIQHEIDHLNGINITMARRRKHD